jgi:thiosulfate/3-mercaptopyruvate sulfurtransferase
MADSPLVSAAWLRDRLGSVRVVDVRWYLDGRRGRDAWLSGHVPGAAYLDVDADLSGAKGPGRPGRHPLPLPADLAASLARIGIGAGARVVAYDDDGGSRAARLWWLLERYGHVGGAHVLDGGLAAWTAIAGALEPGEIEVCAAEPEALHAPDRVRSKSEVDTLRAKPDVLILDARSADRYEGRVEPIDARAGHIPGAKSAPYAGNLVTPGGAFLSREALSARYASLGAVPGREVIAYCGSGVTACHDVLAMALAGIDADLYEGSWSEWAGDSSLPLATGSDP